MSHIVKQIKINCTNTIDYLNRNSNCNFQNLDIVIEDDYEFYNIPENYHFYKAIDTNHQTILEFNDARNIYRKNPTWLSDLRTAYIYYNTYINQGKISKTNCDIFAFKPTRVLKLFNLLSSTNLKKLYDRIYYDIVQKWNEIISTFEEDINITLYEELSLLLKYKYTIEATTGYNATFDEQKKHLNATKKYNDHHIIDGQKIRYKIKNNLHSELKEDLNRISLFHSDSILINILMKYLPQFDGYCSYRTKSLIHYPEFHEEICIFNPEHLLLRARNNACDAINPNNLKRIKYFLVNNNPSFIQEGGMKNEQEQETNKLKLNQELLDKIKQNLLKKHELLDTEQELLSEQEFLDINEQELLINKYLSTKQNFNTEVILSNDSNLIINIYNSLNPEFANYFIKQYKIDDFIIALNILYNHLLIFRIINLIINNSKNSKNPEIKEIIRKLLNKIKFN